MSLDVRAHVASSVVPRVLDVIAQRHTPAIVRALLSGPTSFDALVRALGVSRSTLAARLAHLAHEGCVAKHAGTYALTPRGASLVTIVCAMARWDGVPSGLFCTCDAPLALEARCAACHAPLRARDVRVPDVPSARAPVAEGAPSRTRGLASREVTVLDAGAILSDKWTARVVALAFFGVSRFVDFEALLDIAPNVLADRLERLTEHGVLTRTLYETRPPRSAYTLTRRGHALFDLVLAMIDWGDRTFRPNDRTELLHAPCRAPLATAFVCVACGEVWPRSPSAGR